MESPDPYSLTAAERAVSALQHGVFVLQHVWPLVLVLGVPLAVGGAFLYEAYAGPEIVVGPPACASAAGGGTAAASSLLVASDPAGATVFVDGDRVGTTPVSLGDLRAGVYRVAVEAAGFARADTLVRVAQTSGVAVALRLRPLGGEPLSPAETTVVEAVPAVPAPAPEGPAPVAPEPAEPVAPATGSVEVTVRPWGTITIDGAVRQRDTDVTFREALPAGVHRIRVEHPTLGAREQSVRIRPGRTVPLSFDLNPPGGPP